jgi:hypothetical protein
MSVQLATLSPLVPSVPAAVSLSEPETAFDLVMRDSPKLNKALLVERTLPAWLLKLVSISVLGQSLHGLAVGLVAQLSLRGVTPSATDWLQGDPVVWMPLAMTGALLGAVALCLPSFYFYTQLAGLDASFRLVTAEALRGQAKSAVLLLAALPFYVALALASLLTESVDVQLVLAVGVSLPLLVGAGCIRSLHKAFQELLEVVPLTHVRRGDFLLRLILCWGAVYCVVAPVALYRLGELLGRLL